MAILMLGREFSRPVPFSWVFALLAPASPAEAAAAAKLKEGADIDTRAARPAPRTVAQVDGAIPIEPPPPEPDASDERSLFPGLDAKVLATIQDGTPHRAVEREAYADVIEALATHEDAQLWASVKGTEAEQPLAFSLLFRQPDHYRGRLVHIQAKARACVPFLSGKRIAAELAERMKAVPPGPADAMVQALAKADFIRTLAALDAVIQQLQGDNVDVLAKEALSKHLGQIQDQMQIIADVQKSLQDRLKKERDEALANGQVDEGGTLTADLQEASKRGQQTQKLAEAAHRLRECARLLLNGTKAEALAELQGLRSAVIDMISRNYYHLWLETTEGQLVQAYVLELPAGFPVSKLDGQRQFEQEISEPLNMIAFFFKRLPYQAHDDTRNAPLVFARSVVWSPPPPPPEAASLTWPLVLTVLTGGMVIGVLGAYLLTKGDVTLPKRSEQSPEAVTAADLAGLARLEALAQAMAADSQAAVAPQATDPATPTHAAAGTNGGPSAESSVAPAGSEPVITPSPPTNGQPNGHSANGHTPPAGPEGASASAEGTSHP
jgi:hypothetical protein